MTDVSRQHIRPIFKGKEFIEYGTDMFSRNVLKELYYWQRISPEVRSSYLCFFFIQK